VGGPRPHGPEEGDLALVSGSETQPQDPLIVGKMGAGETPAYRGLACVVFEELPLSE
jgi:hypothetical protein